jgi:hypothetical protein
MLAMSIKLLGIIYRELGTRNGYPALFQWLAHYFKCRAFKLRQFIQKQNTVMCQRDLSGLRVAAASN